MDLYIYKNGADAPLLTVKNAVSYTDGRIITEEGIVYGPFAEDCELSSKPDCSESLRADWRRVHPSTEERMEELEALVAGLLFGGTSADGGEEA